MNKAQTRRRFAAATALAGATALVLSACTGSGNETGDGTATLTLQHSMLPDEAQALMRDYVEQYEAETGVRVEVSYVPWENQRSTTLSKIASGQAPDVVHGNSNQGSSEFVVMGAMA